MNIYSRDQILKNSIATGVEKSLDSFVYQSSFSLSLLLSSSFIRLNAHLHNESTAGDLFARCLQLYALSLQLHIYVCANLEQTGSARVHVLCICQVQIRLQSCMDACVPVNGIKQMLSILQQSRLVITMSNRTELIT